MASLTTAAAAQPAPPPPPSVIIVDAKFEPTTERAEFTGRIEAQERVDLVARAQGVLEQKLFTEGTEVKKGDLLYVLEKGSLAASLEVQEASVAQAQANLINAQASYNRASELVKKGAGTQVNFDSALATLRGAEAQVRSTKALLKQAQITLGYTEIRAPIDGLVGRTSVTIGNVVGGSSSGSSTSSSSNSSSSSSQSSGSSSSGSQNGGTQGSSGSSSVLATIVSQDPMYVTFPVSMRAALVLRNQYISSGPDAVKIKLRLPDGRVYGQSGKLSFIDINVAQDTDTIIFRATIANPALANVPAQVGQIRELANQEFVTVFIESAAPRELVTVPRTSVLSDQQGSYVYVVDDKNIARQRRVTVGQPTSDKAPILDGLISGERVVAEGVQRVRPNMPVSPRPQTASNQAPSTPAVR